MQTTSRWFVWLSSLFILMQSTHATNTLQASQSPAGHWQTIDDVSHLPKALLQITLDANHKLSGKILKVYLGVATSSQAVCLACEGSRHNQPIIGMTILENLQQNAQQISDWEGGQILDPKNGKVYHCTLHLSDNGQQLIVRGYLGLPLFGRSQTWIRVNTERSQSD